MEPKDFVKLFDCPKARLKKGQPYTFKDNWRRDKELRGGLGDVVFRGEKGQW